VSSVVLYTQLTTLLYLTDCDWNIQSRCDIGAIQSNAS